MPATFAGHHHALRDDRGSAADGGHAEGVEGRHGRLIVGRPKSLHLDDPQNLTPIVCRLKSSTLRPSSGFASKWLKWH